MKKLINLNKISVRTLTFDKPGEYVVYFENLSGKIDVIIKSADVHVDIYGLFIGKKSDDWNKTSKQT